MRYVKTQRAESRKSILDAAARRFRKAGIDGSGMAAVMADAGLTKGAFYGHFDSKEDLVREALVSEKASQISEWKVIQASEGFEAALRTYLNTEHRDNPAMGCACAALLGEIARQPLATREAYSGMLIESFNLLATQVSANSDEGRMSRAMSILAVIIGSLQMSRVMTDEKLSLQILESGVEAALAMSRG